MCGITGWYLPSGSLPEPGRLDAMAAAIGHRGPDDRGDHVDLDGRLAMAHLRLSIIDLSPAGHQPMPSGDGSVILAFNGELYNYLALKRELETLGHRFRSRSDTEVMVTALAQWGPAALQRFDGMFALAAWFPKDRTLLLARDPLGMKPLYYAPQGAAGGLAFASEVKALLAMPGMRARVRRASLQQFLEFGYVFEQTPTMFEGISKLAPGHALIVTGGRVGEPYAYYSPPACPDAPAYTVEAGAQSLHDTLSCVVQEHLVADVPVGLLLSGGLDSSVIAALASRHAKVSTISMGFADSAVDERVYARQVAAHIGSDHHEVLISQSEIVEHLQETVWYFDDLFADWGTLSTRLLYKRCRELGAKVVLVGEGSDELFGGYPMHRAATQLRGPMTWRLFQLYRRYAGRRHGKLFPQFAGIMHGYLEQRGGSLFEAVRMFESRNQLPNNYVMKVDKASMSVSVEARAPYLDRRIASLAYATHESHLLAPAHDKLLLRKMAQQHALLPDEITFRQKFGASIAGSWMDESPEFRRYAQSVVLSKDGWVDEVGLRKPMTDYFVHGRRGYKFPRAISLFGNLAWRLLLLDLWARRYEAV